MTPPGLEEEHEITAQAEDTAASSDSATSRTSRAVDGSTTLGDVGDVTVTDVTDEQIAAASVHAALAGKMDLAEKYQDMLARRRRARAGNVIPFKRGG